MGCEATGVCGN